MADVYLTNQPVVLTESFTVGGAATDPTTVALTVVDPTGTSTTYTYALAEITKTSTGVYTKTVTSDSQGVWRAYWTGTGAAAVVGQSDWLVYDPATLTLYAGLDEVKSLVNLTDTNDDLELSVALHSACRSIDKHCGRRFYPDTTATARVFRADSGYCVNLLQQNGSEFYTTSGLAIGTDNAVDGTYSTAWVATDYLLEPLNGIVDGESGWPYSKIVAIESGTQTFPVGYRQTLVQVTAKWGWAAPPEGIRQAAKMLAKDLFKNKDAVGGVAGFDQFGAVRVRQDPMISMLIDPYKRFGVG